MGPVSTFERACAAGRAHGIEVLGFVHDAVPSVGTPASRWVFVSCSEDHAVLTHCHGDGIASPHSKATRDLSSEQ